MSLVSLVSKPPPPAPLTVEHAAAVQRRGDTGADEVDGVESCRTT